MSTKENKKTKQKLVNVISIHELKKKIKYV